MKKVTQALTIVTFAISLATSGPLFASGGHKHGHDDEDDHHKSAMKHEAHADDHHKSGMEHDDHADDHHKSGMEHDDDHHGSSMGKMFLKKKKIDGYDVSFHVMKAKPGKEMGGSHDFMIKVEKNGKAVTNIVMNTKVKHPNGSSQSKKAMKMGDWLMAGYDLGHKGRHQMMILFKTADGKKHKGGVYYSGN